jgi:hypothetical protein
MTHAIVVVQFVLLATVVLCSVSSSRGQNAAVLRSEASPLFDFIVAPVGSDWLGDVAGTETCLNRHVADVRQQQTLELMTGTDTNGVTWAGPTPLSTGFTVSTTLENIAHREWVIWLFSRRDFVLLVVLFTRVDSSWRFLVSWLSGVDVGSSTRVRRLCEYLPPLLDWRCLKLTHNNE